jgi:hypothetical protein
MYFRVAIVMYPKWYSRRYSISGWAEVWTEFTVLLCLQQYLGSGKIFPENKNKN